MKALTQAAVLSIGLVLAGFPALSGADVAQAGSGEAAGNTGDANCDLIVDSIDAALVLQYEAGFITDFLLCAVPDANEDLAVNSIDAALILQYSAGLIASLPPS